MGICQHMARSGRVPVQALSGIPLATAGTLTLAPLSSPQGTAWYAFAMGSSMQAH